jgi:hypothetical protein
MTKAAKVQAGDNVSYLDASPAPSARWRAAKVVSVTDQNNLVLAFITNTGTRSPINGGVAVPRRTTGTQTNVWRPN